MPPKDASKKKKRIAPQLLGPVQGAGGGPANGSAPFGAGLPGGVAAGGGAGSSSGYKRLRIAVSDPGATVKELKAAVKDHNSRYCVPVSGRKADLKNRMTRVAERFEVIERKGKKKGGGGGGGGGGLGGGGGTAGQRAAAKKLKKIASKYGGLDRDANPELAF
jgi:hypothetical protein